MPRWSRSSSSFPRSLFSSSSSDSSSRNISPPASAKPERQIDMELLRTAGRPPFTSAHRGHSTAAPENTLAALGAAWRAGATVAEIDVRMTRDGELVLLHDPTLDRTTTGHGPVSARTLAELAELDAGGWFGAAFAGEAIPRLDEVLDWARGKIGLLVELKNFPERDPRYISRVIETF